MPDVPQIDREDLLEFIRQRFPGARIEWKTINPDYGSWVIEIFTEASRVDICWGPLSGFGGTDLNNLAEDGNPFAAFDVAFDGADDAMAWLFEHV